MNLEERRAYHRAYYRKNRDRILARSRRARKRKRSEDDEKKQRRIRLYGNAYVPMTAFTNDEAVLRHVRWLKENKKKGK